MLKSAEAISPGLARDGEKYTEAINQLVQGGVVFTVELRIA